jgi:hypothetical protein
MNIGESILERLERRAENIQKWLEENGRGCQEEQKHIRAGTVEKIYWHYGYMVALMDVLRFLGRGATSRDTFESSLPANTHQPDRYN